MKKILASKFFISMFIVSFSNILVASPLRESISRGYPFFFVIKGHMYVFYSASSEHLSFYSNIN